MRRGGVVTRIFLVMAFLLVGGLGYAAGSGRLLAPQRAVAADECATFTETGKQVCGRFLEYWRANGGLAQQGLPLSATFEEQNAANGKTYTVQYFERAVFEAHPENQRPYDVLLSLLGGEKYQAKYGSPQPQPAPQANQSPQAGQTLTTKSADSTFSLTITGSERRQTIGRKTANGLYLVVYMKMTNTGKAPASGVGFAVRDQQGRKFTMDFAGLLAGIGVLQGNAYNLTLQPGIVEDRFIVFEVPNDATSFTIEP